MLRSCGALTAVRGRAHDNHDLTLATVAVFFFLLRFNVRMAARSPFMVVSFVGSWQTFFPGAELSLFGGQLFFISSVEDFSHLLSLNGQSKAKIKPNSSVSVTEKNGQRKRRK